MIYTLTLNPAIDYTVFLDAFRPGELNRADKEVISWGGKGINVSRTLNILGVPNIAMGLIAGFTGRALAEGLAAENIRTDLLSLTRGRTRINVKIAACGETEINGTGPMVSPREFDILLGKIRALNKKDTLILSGNAPASISSVMYEDLLGAIAYSGACFICDTSGGALTAAIRYRPFLIKPNLEEMSQLVGRELSTEDEIIAAARETVIKGVQNVLVSLGKEGAVLVTRQEHIKVSAPEGRVYSAVGAGDAMLAAFLSALPTEKELFLISPKPEENEKLLYALRTAVAAGSAIAFSKDPAAPLSLPEMQKLLDTLCQSK